MTQPPYCATCPMRGHCTGFAGDYVPERPRIALIGKMAGKDEVIQGAPMVGRAGQYFEREFLWPLGLQRGDVLYSNVIRCFPHGGEFPVGKIKDGALRHCRKWDEGLKAYRPNLWVVTVHPVALLRTPNQTTFLVNDLKKALRLATERGRAGYRPALLMGQEARELYAPWLHGSMKKWRGHWWEGESEVLK